MDILTSFFLIFAGLENKFYNMSDKHLDRNTDPLQIVLDNTMAKVYVCDVDTYEIVFANKAMKSGFPFDIEGKKCWKSLSSFNGPCPYCKLHEVLKKPLGEPLDWENYNPDLNAWLQMSNSIVTWSDGRKVHLITVTDISEIKNNETKLKEYQETLEKLLAEKTESEQRLKAMADNMPHTFAFHIQRNKNSAKVMYITKGVEAICGILPEDVLDDINHLWKHIHPEDLQKLALETANDKKSLTQEVRFTRPDTGAHIWLHLAETPRPSDGEETIWDGIAMDITLRKDIEEKLKESQEELIRKAQQINDIIGNMVKSAIYRTHLDENKNIVLDYASGNINELLGISEEELKENMGIFISHIHPDDQPSVIPQIVGSTGSMGEAETEVRYIRNNELCWMRLQSKGFTKDGQIYRDGILFDITAQKKMEMELIEARNRAEESDRLKSTFMANMSHEIRTPMNAIVGFLDLMCQEGDDTLDEATKKEFTQLVMTNANQLLQLIGDLLDISKIDAGQMKIIPEQGDLNALMKSIYRSFSSAKTLNGKSIDFILDESGQDEVGIFTIDYTRLQQVLGNLIGNALKFTDTGYVKYGYSTAPEGIRFFVEDSGIGMAGDKLSELGKAFSQIHDPVLAPKYGGTGIGVAISKNLVELMGGILEVDSELGKGSRFVFTIPQ